MPRHLPALLVAVSLLAVSHTTLLRAQVGFGAMVGASRTGITGEMAEGTKSTTTFLVGGFVSIPVGDFAFQPGVVYTRKGFTSDAFSGITPKAAFDFLQVPLVFRIGAPMGASGRYYLGVGPAIGVRVRCRLLVTGGGPDRSAACRDVEAEDGSIALKSTEFSGVGEAGIELGKLTFGIRADLGLSNLYDITSTTPGANTDVKSRTLSAVVGMRF